MATLLVNWLKRIVPGVGPARESQTVAAVTDNNSSNISNNRSQIYMQSYHGIAVLSRDENAVAVVDEAPPRPSRSILMMAVTFLLCGASQVPKWPAPRSLDSNSKQ